MVLEPISRDFLLNCEYLILLTSLVTHPIPNPAKQVLTTTCTFHVLPYYPLENLKHVK